MNMDFKSAKELLDLCEENQLPISEVMRQRECILGEVPRDAVDHRMAKAWEIMHASATQPLKKPIKSMGGLIGGEAKKLETHYNKKKNICGDVLQKAMTYAMAVLEVNASMGLIVAAPTAGSAGVVPGMMLALQECYRISDQRIVDALFNAGAVGYLAMRNATVAGAVGGCQAEVGIASAMAASAAVELMGGNQPSPAFREEILRNIAELDQLVDEILLASRLDAREADVGTVELVDLIGLAAEECARVDAELDVTAVPEGLEVRGVAKLLRRALRNLLENARRYSQGDITVVLQRHDGQAQVSVLDRGPGVPPALRERIFEPFYRLPGASERAGGVGLGLALVRSIAQRHNGSVRCEDQPDGSGGACFVLRLPLALTK